MEPHEPRSAPPPPPPRQPVLEYRVPRREKSERSRAWGELGGLLMSVGPGCLVVAAVVVLMLVYGMIAVAMLWSDS